MERSFSEVCEHLIKEIKSGKCPLHNCPICKTPPPPPSENINDMTEFVMKMVKGTTLLNRAVSDLMRQILDGEIISNNYLVPGPRAFNFEIIHKLNEIVDQITKDVKDEANKIK